MALRLTVVFPASGDAVCRAPSFSREAAGRCPGSVRPAPRSCSCDYTVWGRGDTPSPCHESSALCGAHLWCLCVRVTQVLRVHACTHKHAHMPVGTHVRAHTCTHKRACGNTYPRAHMNTHTCLWTHTHGHTRAHTHTRACGNTPMGTHMHTPTHVPVGTHHGHRVFLPGGP